jgi:ribosomal protein S3
LNKLIKKLRSLFYKKDVNIVHVKRRLQQYFINQNIPASAFEIHYIEVKTKKSEIIVTITLGRPGLFIGKQGRTLDEIRKYLSDTLEKPVKIQLMEYDVWY